MRRPVKSGAAPTARTGPSRSAFTFYTERCESHPSLNDAGSGLRDKQTVVVWNTDVGLLERDKSHHPRLAIQGIELSLPASPHT